MERVPDPELRGFLRPTPVYNLIRVRDGTGAATDGCETPNETPNAPSSTKDG
jgi:hypothetical protein